MVKNGNEKFETERMFVMNAVPAEILKEYVKRQGFTSTEEIMNAMKDMFRDVIQQVMESEPETELG